MKNLQNMQVEPSFPIKVLSAGMAACAADMITFPLDTAKVRLQIQRGKNMKSDIPNLKSPKYEGMFGTMKVIATEEGLSGLYKGIVAGLHRQMCFSSVRVGCYDEVKMMYMKVFSRGRSENEMTVGIRMLSGLTTSAISVCIAQPTDVVKVRMQAHSGSGGTLYSGAINAYATIAKTEGIYGLWRGCTLNTARNSIVGVSELVTYDMVKTYLIKHNLLIDGVPCHFVSAFCAGFCATIVASPVDVIKTRFMNSQKGQNTGVLDIVVTILKENGLSGFYKGFVPSFMRLGSWTVCMFLFYEQIKRLMTTKSFLLLQ